MLLSYLIRNEIKKLLKKTRNFIFDYNLQKGLKKSYLYKDFGTTSIKMPPSRIQAQENRIEDYYGNMTKDLITSENDPMSYRLIQLHNGLKAILISDASNIVNLSTSGTDSSEESEDSEESDESEEDVVGELTESEEDDSDSKKPPKGTEEKMAACSLSIGVGSFSDPPEIPGLAHFLEHMVFMGSKKYPQENGFDEFIKKNGGSDNGSTECETTTFYFECNEKHLKDGMDRFAQFFISPLMKAEAMTREREIIHSEFEMTLPSDGTRREQILGSLAPSDHPSAKFFWGNLTTLRDNVEDSDLYEKVHAFQKRHYSAHRMTLAVQARLPLDTLEEYVREFFSDVPNNGLPPDDFTRFSGSYGNDEKFNKIIWIKPVKDISQVHLTWVLPSYLKEYKSLPLDYLGWLVGHESEGSILSLLRKKVWALECEAGNDGSGFELNTMYSLFSISLTLTEEGYHNINEVIKLVFSYISMLKKNCPNKAVYDELQKISDTNFRYKPEIPSANYVEIMSESMQVYEPKHYIAGGELYMEYKPEIISEILELLSPDRVNIMINSSDKSDDFYTEVEPWFETKFKIESIPNNWKTSWLHCEPHEEFHIPFPNPYLTDDFSILPEPEENPPYPVKLKDTDLLEIWYRQDTKFKKPRAYYSFYLISPIIKADPFNAVLLDVLSAYLDKKFTEHIFSANQAGLYCTYSPADSGLVITFHGYSEKLALLVDKALSLTVKICSEINNEKNEKLFNAIKKERRRIHYNRALKPQKLVKSARLTLLVEKHWNCLDYLRLIDEVTLEKLKKFTEDFFQKVRIVGLIQGNVSKELALDICDKFKTVLNCSPFEGEKPQNSVAKLNEGELYLRLQSFNQSDRNSVVNNYYQVGPLNIKETCLIDLLMMLMDEPLFDTLRTKQQIGYDVQCLLRDTFGILGFSITVFFQVHKFSPDEVDLRVEEFLKIFLKQLKDIRKKDFEEAKNALALLKKSADLELQDEVKRNFAEICSNEYVFDRMKKEAEIIPEITQKEFNSWFADHILSGKKCKKLSVQVIGGNQANNDSTPVENHLSENPLQFKILSEKNTKKTFITDIKKFQSNRQFYPIQKKH